MVGFCHGGNLPESRQVHDDDVEVEDVQDGQMPVFYDLNQNLCYNPDSWGLLILILVPPVIPDRVSGPKFSKKTCLMPTFVLFFWMATSIDMLS